ncbi:MAG: lysophospholipid acyltransferase family protein [Acidobacteria bacterium]|nr:lysophospholipid acyltransferase family protein [Acidobacteriota bacterium]
MLPRSMARPCAGLLLRILYQFTPKLRAVAARNLEMALPALSRQDRNRMVRGVYRSLARLLAAFAHFPSLTPENVSNLVAFDGLENYDAALAKGRGVVFLTAHIGAWELGAFAHGLKGYRLNVVYRALDNPSLNDLVNRYRSLGGNRLIEKRESARGILAALARNETVGILADQNTLAEEGVFVNFFGVPACATAGIARIALHSGATVVPAFCVWDAKAKRFRILYERPLDFSVTGDTEQDVQAATQQMANVIERVVRAYPDQWLWIHRRWRTRPPGQPSLYP